MFGKSPLDQKVPLPTSLKIGVKFISMHTRYPSYCIPAQSQGSMNLLDLILYQSVFPIAFHELYTSAIVYRKQSLEQANTRKVSIPQSYC
jgi:hypothetical protein